MKIKSIYLSYLISVSFISLFCGSANGNGIQNNSQKGPLVATYQTLPYDENTKIKELKLKQVKTYYGRTEEGENKPIKSEILTFEYYLGRLLSVENSIRTTLVYYLPENEDVEGKMLEKLRLEFDENDKPIGLRRFLGYEGQISKTIVIEDILNFAQPQRKDLLSLIKKIKARQDHTVTIEELKQIDTIINTQPLLMTTYIQDLYDFPLEIITGPVNGKDSLKALVYYDNSFREIGRVTYMYNPQSQEYDLLHSFAIFKYYTKDGKGSYDSIELFSTDIPQKIIKEIDEIITQFKTGKISFINPILQRFAKTKVIDMFTHKLERLESGFF